MTDGLLTAAERRILAVACETFCPRLEPAPGEPATLFGTGAGDLGVAATLERALAALSARQRRELRLFIRLLDAPAFMLLAAGTPHGITSLSPAARERALLALARSPLSQVRTGFHALKRLSTFLFYAVTDADGRNPLWPGIGYQPARPTPAIPDLLKITRVTAPTVLDADACVVGSGAAGGVVAARLAARGLQVLVVEAGHGDQASAFDQREIVGMQRLYLDEGTTATRDLSVAILAGSCVGGGTTINWQTSLRLPDFIRDEWSARAGIAAFTSDRFTTAFDSVSERLNVGTAESVHNGNNLPLGRGATALGYRWSVIARNSKGCDLAQCGYCVFGCRTGAKQATSVTYLVDAQRDGDTRIVADCRADRLRFSGKAVTGVACIATDPVSGRRHEVEVRARLVVLCAGAIETPALLLRSGVDHPAVGRHLHLHPTTAIAGAYDEPTRGWSGAPQTVLCHELDRLEGNYGVRIETAPINPGLLALANPWHGGRRHRELMRQASHASGFIVLSRDEGHGRVRVDRTGRAVITYRVGRRERRMLQQGLVAAARIHHAAGALEIHAIHVREQSWRRASGAAFEDFTTSLRRAPLHGNRAGLFSAHQMGTCRMGNDARRDPCDATGAVRGTIGLHVADASLFPASSGVNPMLTVMALADMVCDGLPA